MYKIEQIAENCKLLYRQIPGQVAHLAVFNECGSRHERDFPEGIAHFTEHMIFKGTQARKSHHIIAGLENTGCEVNAYTSKEELVLHASFLDDNFSRILLLFCEMLFDSTFPENEIEKERNIILDEIASLKDNPQEIIGDRFESIYYKGHPLEREILGNKKTLKQINRETICRFNSEIFLPSEKVVVYFGPSSFQKVLKLLKTQIDGRLTSPVVKNIERTIESPSFEISQKIHSHQTHVMLGTTGYHIHHKNRTSLGLLVNILGGQAFNSRLNMSVREKKGLSYNIDAYYNIFSDNGYVSVNYSCEYENVDKIRKIIDKEIQKLKKNKIGTLQLHTAKKQFIGQTAIFLDNAPNDMISAGKSLLFTSQVPSFQELKTKVEEISSEDILNISNEVFQDTTFCSLTLY